MPLSWPTVYRSWSWIVLVSLNEKSVTRRAVNSTSMNLATALVSALPSSVLTSSPAYGSTSAHAGMVRAVAATNDARRFMIGLRKLPRAGAIFGPDSVRLTRRDQVSCHRQLD